MDNTKNHYTVSIYTENNIGLLNRISAIFQRRHIIIESLNTSASEIDGVSRFTILVIMTEDQIKKIVGQIEKQVEVIKAFYHRDEDTIYQESCLFLCHIRWEKGFSRKFPYNRHIRPTEVEGSG